MKEKKAGETSSLGKNRKTHFRSGSNRGESETEKRAKNTRQLRWERQREAQKISADERLSKCNWAQLGHTVTIKKSTANSSYVFFAKVETCSRVWLCPICSAKITDGRQKQLLLAAVNAKILGLHMYMIVFTCRHKRYDPVKTVLDLMLEATSRLKGTRFWGRMTEKYKIAASCTALEVTFSRENGAHVHKHVLQFLWRELKPDEIAEWRNEISHEYQKKLNALGGSAESPYDVQIKSGADYLAEYIAKFGRNPKDEHKATRGITYEMTKLPNKLRSMLEGHYTPFHLLDLSKDGDKWARVMWRRYADAFWRKAQLTWSRNAAELLALGDELSDEEINNKDDPDFFDFANMQKDSWYKARNIPHEISEAARTMVFSEFAEWCLSRGIVIEKPIIDLASDLSGKTISLG